MLLPQHHFTASVDLKDGYWHVPITPKKRPYLGFEYQNTRYQFRAMPFGLNIAPRIFTKLIAHVTKTAAEKGIFMLAYLDDILVIAPTFPAMSSWVVNRGSLGYNLTGLPVVRSCLGLSFLEMETLQDLGWVVNERKSRLQPQQAFQWLGLAWDLQSFHCVVPQETQAKLRQDLFLLRTSTKISKREVMKVQGLINWVAMTDYGAKPLMSVTRRELVRTRRLSLDFQYCPPKSFQLSLMGFEDKPSPPLRLGVPIQYLVGDDRCFKGRMGNQIPGPSTGRDVRQVFGNKRHSTKRAPCDFLGFTSRDRYRGIRSSPHRLISVCSGSKKGLFKEPPIRPTSLGDMATSDEKVNRPTRVVHPRQLQRSGRSVVKGYHHIHRVVNQQEGLPSASTESRLYSSGGPVCNRSEQEVQVVHVSMSRSSGCCSRLLQHQLGQVGLPVSLPPDTCNFEGFGEAEAVSLQKSLISVPSTSRQALASKPCPARQDVFRAVSGLGTDGQRQDGAPRASNEIGRLHFIREHYSRFYPARAAELMSLPIRQSSCREYENKWKHFLNFLNEEGIEIRQCTLNNVLKFFITWFDKKGLMASTVAHYRSALSVPLRIVLKIDILNPAVSDMIKAMALLRPSKPFTAPSWNLQKVLDFLDGLPTRIAYEDTLGRAAFLLLLCTGWRVSELHACVKLSDYCSVSPDGSLRLRPHEIFLAKNELSQVRWPHSTIQPLVINNRTSKLCPVKNFLDYIKISSPRGEGPLFTSREGKPLTIFALSRLVVKLILKGDPETKVKVHDIRKYASSLAFMKMMDIKDLLHSMKWKSSSAFYRHYLFPTSTPCQDIAVPGGQYWWFSDGCLVIC